MTQPSKIQSIEDKPSSARTASGAGMDRKVKPKASYGKPLWIAVLITLVLLISYYLINKASNGKVLSVNSEKLAISVVQKGTFEDFIPIRGRVTPAKTVYLDAIEGGRVERIVVEDGARLNAGEMIVELSNASLQLSVLSNEAQVAEQLNNIRSIELSLEQNRLQHKRNLVDIRYQIKRLSRQLEREQALVKSGAMVVSTMEDTQDELQWFQDRLQITLESQNSDARMQESQLDFLQQTGQRLEGNLALSRQNLESMKVKAPVAGKLSGFNVEVGQSIGRGERLGQIDTPNDFKLSAFLDEFYLGRVDIDQHAQFDDYQLRVAKVYPQVNNGQFEVDLEFIGNQPKDIRRGQTIQTKLTLGDASEALLIPNGAFYQDTGGAWIFVVSEDTGSAYRRDVRLGRRNSRYIEVLDGLEVGEKVITSPYTSYTDIQRLTFE